MDVLWTALAYLATTLGGLGLLCLAAGQLDDMLGDGEATTRLSFLGAALLSAGILLYVVCGGARVAHPSEDVDLPGPPPIIESV